MKKLFLSLFIIFSPFIIFAQNATLHITLSNSTSTSCNIWMPDAALTYDHLNKGSFEIPLVGGKGSHTFKLTKPQFAYLVCTKVDGKNEGSFSYLLYLSPGDDLYFKADLNSKENGIVVTGKGSNNNQPLLASLADENFQAMYGDTLPNRIIAIINKRQATLNSVRNKYISMNKSTDNIAMNKDQPIPNTTLNTYISLYKPTDDFIKNVSLNIKYDAVYQYFDFKENNKFGIGDAYKRNQAKWNAIQDSLFAIIKLNNDEALIAPNYTLLLRTFLLREKERLWEDSHKNPEAFYKEWYNTDVTTGKKEFEDDKQNLLKEKIINHYFTKRPAEYLYGELFDEALDEHNPKNIVSIFDRFKKKYPNSKYITWFGPSIDTIREKQKQKLSADMIFAPDNGTKLKTFNDVLAMAKGKTVLLDMWGTWCGPCRMEIANNGPAIKDYFKGKGLEYYYVANYDIDHEAVWKDLIAYLDMKGTHILATDSLSNNIMKTVKSGGFPTYVIIKKDGTWELSKAGYPMKRDVLITQIENALKQ